MSKRLDEGHELTEKQLAALEKKIAKVYKQAGKELQGTIDAYFEKFKERDEEMKSLIGTEQNGKEWTEADYKQWRLNQMARGERYQALRDKVAKRMTDANAVAVAYTNDETPSIYSLNRNYAAYTIEQVSDKADFTLWDEQTVKRLITEEPNLMPYYPKERALKRGIDLAYGKKQITASVTSSILQGKSIKGIADDLQGRMVTMNRASAIRTARTAVTGAQNAGRMDSYAAAEKMGIKLKKEWLATLDARTRHSHAMLDGEQVAQDKKFSNGCRFPGDPQGPAWEIYNCRCTLIAAVDGVDTADAQRRARNAETGGSSIVSDMTYQEWAGWKKEASYVDIRTLENEDYGIFSEEWNAEVGKMISRMKNNAIDWGKENQSAARVVSDYTHGKDWYLNTYARTVGNEKEFSKFVKKAGEKNVEYAETMGNLLQKSLEKAELGENVVAFRGISGLAPFEKAIGKKYDPITGKFGKKFSPQEFVGAEITEKGFMSMSLDENRAKKFISGDIGALFEIRVPRSANAIYAEPFSYYGENAMSREMEVLAKKGTTIKIVEIDTTQKIKNAFGEEVTAPWKIIAEVIS